MRHAFAVAKSHLTTTQLLDDRSYTPLEGQMAWVHPFFDRLEPLFRLSILFLLYLTTLRMEWALVSEAMAR